MEIISLADRWHVAPDYVRALPQDDFLKLAALSRIKTKRKQQDPPF